MSLRRPLVVVALLIAAASRPSAGSTSAASVAVCDFERPCDWESRDSGFKIVTGIEVNNTWIPKPGYVGGPFTDADNNTNGHFLYVGKKDESTTSTEYHIRSPKFTKSNYSCRLSFWYHMYMEAPAVRKNTGHPMETSDMIKHVVDMRSQRGGINVVIENSKPNKTQWVIKDIQGDTLNKDLVNVRDRTPNDNSNPLKTLPRVTWVNVSLGIGKQSEFSIVLIVTLSNRTPTHAAIDNISLTNCFQGIEVRPECTPKQFKCSNNSACIDQKSVCDLVNDCANGEDENQSCDDVPPWARCTFEEDMCYWENKFGRDIHWKMKNGSLATSMGPPHDHTYKNPAGKYIYVDMTGGHKMGTSAELESPLFNPPPLYHSNISSPYYNSCYISFFYHKYGPHSGSLGLFLIELKSDTNDTIKLWWSYGTKESSWQKHVVTLPNNMTSRYYLVFEARKSYATRGDPALDDISMSPRCFGRGVPESHLNGYEYDAFEETDPTPPLITHRDFENSTYYRFTTCGQTGPTGPTQEQCDVAYNNSEVEVEVQTDKRLAGIQKWVVPETGYYTIVAKGASGGMGGDGQGISKGALVRSVMELKKGQSIYILVGQEGMQSCRKNFVKSAETVCHLEGKGKEKTRIGDIRNLKHLPEGGGGGGGSFVFLVSKNGLEQMPLVVAGGGGGLAHGSTHTTDTMHYGQGLAFDQSPLTGITANPNAAGAGGGWAANNASFVSTLGLSLMQGGGGGKPCYKVINGSKLGSGGFGGGGGGCTAGGGGGGYTGGRAWAGKGMRGEGGFSWIQGGFLHRVWVAPRAGPGEVWIIPAVQGCDCDYLCVALDQVRSATQCLCPDNWHLSNDSIHCLMNPVTNEVSFSTTLLGAICLIFIFMATVFTVYLYSRYLKKKNAMIRRKMLSGTDLQLNRLRVASDSMMTEYNPNYEFGGGIYSLKDLKEIPRENLRLVKALGQGAFGEVYQGLYRHRAGDAVEMPVAVKTLPHLSTSQAETDFLMEALIMSKFKHPNIVHFIGVCFDQHPRFIVIELLAGGDLKTFLREARPKPDRAASLTMKDLLSCIVDVAKGCKYMEENRFIHRDIAARNCLLTTKGPGRVVKIADFGMARDIYRADYYRKGGKAMLPIKWMPPEAFLDGIFTTKTDVWSFGVLMWEVLSMGYMPYTGCANREVMQLVTNGGRLAPPTNCPPQLYAIMTQCWQPNPEERPGFGLILERLGYCMQDPDVKRAPLPVYTKPPSSERDTTIMRSSAPEECIQPDYLIPLSGPQEWADYPDQLSDRTRSTQRLIEADSAPSPTVNNVLSNGPVISSTNNNNPCPAPQLTKPHLNNLNNDPSLVYTVSSTLKQDTEISC